MTVVLFHHVLGLTDGVRALGDRLRTARHDVVTPDLFGGATASTIEEGLAVAQGVGDDTIAARAAAAVDAVSGPLVVAGVSFGVMSAQTIAQTRPGVAAALLYEACLPVTGEWAIGPWPAGVPVQIHGADGDPYFAGEGDLEAAKQLVELAPSGLATLYVYASDAHLFTDSSLPSFDPSATDLVVERSLALLSAV